MSASLGFWADEATDPCTMKKLGGWFRQLVMLFCCYDFFLLLSLLLSSCGVICFLFGFLFFFFFLFGVHRGQVFP